MLLLGSDWWAPILPCQGPQSCTSLSHLLEELLSAGLFTVRPLLLCAPPAFGSPCFRPSLGFLCIREPAVTLWVMVRATAKCWTLHHALEVITWAELGVSALCYTLFDPHSSPSSSQLLSSLVDCRDLVVGRAAAV